MNELMNACPIIRQRGGKQPAHKGNEGQDGQGGKMKTQIAAGILFLLLALLCLGHMGQLVPMLPRAWFLMFVGASATISYAALGYLLIRHAIKARQGWLATQNRRRPTGNSLTAVLRRVTRMPEGR